MELVSSQRALVAVSRMQLVVLLLLPPLVQQEVRNLQHLVLVEPRHLQQLLLPLLPLHLVHRPRIVITRTFLANNIFDTIITITTIITVLVGQ